MEKQPIDDLFHRKLHDAEVTPGADAFARLQSRLTTPPLPAQQPQRRFVGWWYGAAAACMVVALGWAYLWLSAGTSPSVNPPTRVAQVKPPVTQPITTDKVVEPRKGHARPMAESGRPFVAPPRTQLAARQPGSVLPRTQLTASPAIQQTVQANVQAGQPITAAQQTPQSIAQRSPTNVPAEASVKQPESQSSPGAMPVVVKQTETRHSAERVVVLSFDEPLVGATIASKPAVIEAVATQQPSPSLSQLVAKVKQLKNGELLASATPAKPAAEPRTGLGRLFNGVKETLRNE